MTEPLLLPLKDTCNLIGCRTTKIYELITRGLLDARKLDGRTVVTSVSIQEYVANLPRASIHLALRQPVNLGDRRGDGTASGQQASENTGSKAESRSAGASNNPADAGG